MSGTDNTIIQRQTLGEQTLSITLEQLLNFINTKKLSNPCESCGSRDWYFAQDDDGPTIISSVNVRSPGTSSWFFFMSCNTCANTRFMEAGKVWEHFFSQAKDASE